METNIELYDIENQLKLLGVEGTQAIINEIVKKINKDNIVQSTGNSQEKIMSQKAVTDALENLTGGEIEPNEWFGTKDEFEMLDSKEEGKWYYIYED